MQVIVMSEKDYRRRGNSLYSIVLESNITNTRNWLIFIFLFYTLWSNTVNADDLHLVFNGMSHHSNADVRKSYNEKNLGVGIQYDFSGLDKNLLPSVYLGGLNDSFENPSYYIGTGLSHRTRFNNLKSRINIDAGMLLLVMSREYTYKSGRQTTSIVPAALPMLSIGTNTTALNITYIPKIDEMNASVWFMQLKIKLDSF